MAKKPSAEDKTDIDANKESTLGLRTFRSAAFGAQDDDDEEQEEEEEEEEEQEEEEQEEEEEEEQEEEEQEEEEEEENEEGDEEEEEEEEEEEGDEDDDPLGLKKKGNNKVSKEDKALIASINKKHKTKFASTEEMVEAAKRASQLEENIQTIENDLARLPKEILAGIKAFEHGEEYMDAINSISKAPDYSKKFSAQDKRKLVEFYIPKGYARIMKKVQEEEIDEDDIDAELEAYYDEIEDKFNSDKKKFEKTIQENKDNQIKLEKAFSKSIIDAVANVRKEFPKTTAKTIEAATNILRNADKVVALYYTKEGILKPDAIKKLIFSLESEKIIKTFVSSAKRDGESEATIKLVRGSKGRKVRAKKSSADRSEEGPSLGFLKKRDPFASRPVQ